MCPFLFICTDAPGVKDRYSIATDRSVTSITQWGGGAAEQRAPI
jgi:hypothetical protein